MFELTDLELLRVSGGIDSCHPAPSVKPKPKQIAKPKVTATCGTGSTIHFKDHEVRQTSHLVIDSESTIYIMDQWD